ncbi:MAG: DUF1801 domain-containing protein [Bauldia sp.]|nr:DUF1801 domain-containing protein [Bauldia sp.]MCW5717708.1 DUF1801 domain-containing protein [Bauldia sp.]
MSGSKQRRPRAAAPVPVPPAELDALVARHPATAALAAELVALVARVAPDLAAKVRQGWGSVNFRHSRAGFVCAVFPAADRVLLVFEHGRELSHPLLVDNGKVKQVRWIPFLPGDAIPEDEIAILIAEAIALRA